MVKAGCHVGRGIICLDEANASAPCRRDHTNVDGCNILIYHIFLDL
jgi:hypothetical protein